MVIIMDMTSGKNEQVDGIDEPAEPPYGEEVLLAGWTALPADVQLRPAPTPRLAEMTDEARAVADGIDEFLSRMYAAQGLPGRR